MDAPPEALVIRGVPVVFPVDKKPYGPQLAFMAKTLQALQESKHALLEAPTGTGKSLALLCSALAWQAEEKRKALVEFQSRKGEAAAAGASFGSILKSGAAPLVDTPVALSGTRHDDGSDEDYDADFKPRKKLAVAEQQQQQQQQRQPSPPVSTAAAVEAALAEQQQRGKPRKPPRIYIASRTHAQLQQLVKELRASPYRPSMVLLGSRDQYCVHPVVSRAAAGSRNQACKKLLQEAHGCSFKLNKARLYLHPSLQSGGAHEVWDVEDLVSLGHQTRACPYFAARQMMTGAELVFCPYNYLLEPGIRKSLGIKIAQAVIIFDEAHNIESIASETASFDFELSAFESAVLELRRVLFKEVPGAEEMVACLESFAQWLVTLADGPLDRCALQKDTAVWEGSELVALMDNVGITTETLKTFVVAFDAIADPNAGKEERDDGKAPPRPDGNEHMGGGDDEDDGLVTDHRVGERATALSSATEAVLRGLFTVLTFLLGDEKLRFVPDYKLVIAKTEERRGQLKKMVTRVGFWCLNPAVAFAALRDEARCIVLASGTLAPMESFASELGVDFPVRLETGHVIDTSTQLWAGIVPVHDASRATFNWTYKNTDSAALQDALGAAVLDTCRVVPKGVLCFFSSYGMLRKVERRWRDTGLWDALLACKCVVVEPQSSDGGPTMETIMTWYYAANGNDRPAAKGRKFSDLFDARTGKRKTARRGGGGGGGGTVVADGPPVRPGQTGGLFLAVCRGKASEGIDFTDDNARAVILVGIPFPSSQDLRVQYKKSYNTAKRQTVPAMLNGQDWYSLQAFRALNQAIGRCIRHRHDFGAVIFFDERYLEARTQRSVSKWIRPQLRAHGTFAAAMESLGDFFRANAPPTAAPVPQPSPPLPLAAAESAPALPTEPLARVCCGGCFRHVGSVDERAAVAVTVAQRYVCDMSKMVSGSAEDVCSVDVMQLPESQLTAHARPVRDEWVPADGLVYSVLQCTCTALLGVSVKAATLAHTHLVGSAWLLRSGVSRVVAKSTPTI